MTEKPLKVLKIPTSFPLPKPYSPSERKTPAFQEITMYPYTPRFIYDQDFEKNLERVATIAPPFDCPICKAKNAFSNGVGRRFSFCISGGVLFYELKQEKCSLEGLDIPTEVKNTSFWWEAFLNDELLEDHRWNENMLGFALNDLLACPNASCREKLKKKIRHKSKGVLSNSTGPHPAERE